jgi:hypothetical protein
MDIELFALLQLIEVSKFVDFTSYLRRIFVAMGLDKDGKGSSYIQCYIIDITSRSS